MAAESVYDDCQIIVSKGETITFLSGGVVEARDTKGARLGFDRTQELSTRGAHEIGAVVQLARRLSIGEPWIRSCSMK